MSRTLRGFPGAPQPVSVFTAVNGVHGRTITVESTGEMVSVACRVISGGAPRVRVLPLMHDDGVVVTTVVLEWDPTGGNEDLTPLPTRFMAVGEEP